MRGDKVWRSKSVARRVNSRLAGRLHAWQYRSSSADDATIMRQLIRDLLQARPELEVVGEAGDFAQTMRMATELKPHVVVMDLHMPSGIRTTPADIKSGLESCGSKLLAISIWNDEDSRSLASDFGALSLLNKLDLSETLVPAILQLALPDAGELDDLILAGDCFVILIFAMYTVRSGQMSVP